MRLVTTLSGSALALTAICFAAGDEPAPPRRAEKSTAQASQQTNNNQTNKNPISKKGTALPAATGTAKPPAQAAPKETTAPAAADDKNAADEAAIRETGETFAKAFEKGDAKAVAAHFTLDAEYVDEQGNVFQGRQAIETSLTAFFAENPDRRLDVTIDTIRFVSPGVAIEDGMTAVTSPEGGTSNDSRYTAVHVKANGKWLTASSREHAPNGRRQHATKIQQLDWLVGNWVDEDDDSIVEFSCQVADNGHFLLRQFTVKIAGQESMTGTQRIGWDPVGGKLCTWIFDSEGGYGEGTWHRNGDSWVLKTTGVTADGQTASGSSIYTLVSDHIMTWQAVDHEIAGVQLPDGEVVTIVRKPPSPTDDDIPVVKN